MKSIVQATLAALGLTCGAAQAGGLYLYEIGTDDVGLAGAGLAARAQDAATIFGNPAGLTRLEGEELDIGAQLLWGKADFQLDGTGAVPGASPGNVMEPFPALSVFYSRRVNEKLSLGFGAFGNFGLGLDFGDWAGDALVKDALLTALTLQPTLAYKLNDQWSLGAGLGVNYGIFSLNRDAAGGEENLKDGDWSPNARLGMLYSPDAQTRMGLNYTSATRYDFDVNTDVTLSHSVSNPLPGLPPITVSKTFSLPLQAMVNTPQQAMFSLFRQVDPRWALMGNLGWQDWSAYGDSEVWAANREIPASDRLQDTWHAAVGVQHQYDGKLTLNAGIAFDTSFYKSQDNASLTMPSGDAWRFGFGGRYRLDAKSSLGAAFEYLRVDGAHVPNVLFSGDYDTMKLYFVALNYRRTF